MITYLKEGWYNPRGGRRMRSAVVDGAIDAAGMLFRGGVPPSVLASVAFKLRSLVAIVDPFMHSDSAVGQKQRDIITQRVEPLTVGFPVLHGFIVDCLEHVKSPADLRAFYLHLVHVSQMVQILSAAMGPGAAGSLQLPAVGKGRKKASKKAPAKKASKKAPVKKTSKTAVRKKVAAKAGAKKKKRK